MTDITIPQGSLYEWAEGLRIGGVMFPLTVAHGGTRALQARMQIRRKAGATDPEDLFLDLSSLVTPNPEGSGLWLDETPGGEEKVGFVWVRVAPASSALLTSKGEWDVEVYDPADPVFVIRLNGGKVLISKQVTLP